MINEDLKNKLLPIWADVNESLDIMKGFHNGEISKSDAKKIGKNGVRRLERARKTLGEMAGMPDSD